MPARKVACHCALSKLPHTLGINSRYESPGVHWRDGSLTMLFAPRPILEDASFPALFTEPGTTER